MVRRSINRKIAFFLQNGIPMMFVGMLFFCSAYSQELAYQLADEKKWNACLRECQRIKIEHGEMAPSRIHLLDIFCRIQMNKEDKNKLLEQLSLLKTRTDNPETAASASFEMGRLLWSQHRDLEALDSFAFSFQTTTNSMLFLQAACSSFLVMEKNHSLRSSRPDLVQQINTSRALWFGELFGACRLQIEHQPLFSPANWIVHFYRSQISPAIGQRCTLEPSCSEYFHQAAIRHGPLSVPLIADRFIREPTVNNEKKDPVFVRGMLRYRDPLDAHDFWIKK
jgi:putative component of membrane protein insertase Oxa1/YidC/SpoIIIJ protein YidD